jgi:acyl-CoA thioester hydrolase
MSESFRYHTTLRVRFNETDLQGHVNFAWYLNYFDVALTGYLSALGYSYHEMLEQNLDMFYVNANATYHAPSYFDDELRLHCRLGHIGNTSMRFDLQIFCTADERLVATGEITAIMAHPETKNKLRVPDHLRQAVAAYETTNGDL